MREVIAAHWESSFSLFIPTQILSTPARFVIVRSLWYTHVKSGMDGGTLMRQSIEQSIRTAEVSLRMEGLQVFDDCKDMCRRMLSGEITMNQYLDYVKLSMNVH